MKLCWSLVQTRRNDNFGRDIVSQIRCPWKRIFTLIEENFPLHHQNNQNLFQDIRLETLYRTWKCHCFEFGRVMTWVLCGSCTIVSKTKEWIFFKGIQQFLWVIFCTQNLLGTDGSLVCREPSNILSLSCEELPSVPKKIAPFAPNFPWPLRSI